MTSWVYLKYIIYRKQKVVKRKSDIIAAEKLEHEDFPNIELPVNSY